VAKRGVAKHSQHKFNDVCRAGMQSHSHAHMQKATDMAADALS